MEYYDVKIGLDVPSLKIKGTGLLYGFETEEEYNKSDYETCDMGTFEFEFDLSNGKVKFITEEEIDENEFLENFLEIVQEQINKRKEEYEKTNFYR